MRSSDLDISRLTVAERIQLAEDLWNSVAAETGGLPLTEPQAAELDRRLAELPASPMPRVLGGRARSHRAAARQGRLSWRLVVRPAAEADIADAALWYELRSPGPREFLRAVDVTLAEAARIPERYPVVHREVRRALLRRFPYGVYFVVAPGLVTVVACMHVRRDPRRWQERRAPDR